MSTATATPTSANVTVAEYRSAIDSLSYWFASLRGCRGAEKAVEAEHVRQAARRLMALECRRAKADDRQQAERLIDITASYLVDNGL